VLKFPCMPWPIFHALNIRSSLSLRIENVHVSAPSLLWSPRDPPPRPLAPSCRYDLQCQGNVKLETLNHLCFARILQLRQWAATTLIYSSGERSSTNLALRAVLLLSGHAWHLLELPLIVEHVIVMLCLALSSHENVTHLKMVLHEAIRPRFTDIPVQQRCSTTWKMVCWYRRLYLGWRHFVKVISIRHWRAEAKYSGVKPSKYIGVRRQPTLTSNIWHRLVYVDNQNWNAGNALGQVALAVTC
jgi:hypothetical protein